MILKTKRLNNELWVALYRRMQPTDTFWLLVAVLTLDENVFPDLEAADKAPIDMAGLFAWQIDRKGSDTLLHFYDSPVAPAILTVTPDGAEEYKPNID
jgi:hypothetical protein